MTVSRILLQRRGCIASSLNQFRASPTGYHHDHQLTSRALLHNTTNIFNQTSSSNQTNRTMATTNVNNKLLSLDNINPNVIKMEYAVRGPLVIRAAQIEKELQEVSRINN